MPTLLFLAILARGADGTERLDQLFASWQEAQRGVKSLVVEFTQETSDRVFKEREISNGTFRLVRTPAGKVFASFDVIPAEKGKGQRRISILLRDGKLYELDHDVKVAVKIDLPEGDVCRFLELVNPFVRLLDRNRAEADFRLEIKQDDSYTYLAVAPRQAAPPRSWFESILIPPFHGGVVALMNKESPNVPKDMPRQLRWDVGGNELRYEIIRWRLNAPGAPTGDEFTRPEDRPGWQVRDTYSPRSQNAAGRVAPR